MKPPIQAKQSLLRDLEGMATRQRLKRYAPYPRQAEFHAAGAQHRERLFMAGNQLGKTLAGAMEAALHATGDYPAWWQGRRFDQPTVGWAAGHTAESTRDTVQRLLLGRPGAPGTGAIPQAALIGATPGRGAAETADVIRVRHASQGISSIALKAYEKGREKWQGETLDWLWFDEEPPLDVYIEGLTRTNATGGLVWVTFTPLKGMSEVVTRFLVEQAPGTHVTRMAIEEAPHYSAAARERIIAAYPLHEREARANGAPTLGSGRVFPINEPQIRYETLAIPEAWPRIVGLDFGWDHPTAAAWLAWDKDTDTVYVYDCYRVREQTPAVHALAIKARGRWFPVAWPRDGLQHDKGSGETLASFYREAGVRMLRSHAQFADGGSGLEAGIALMLERMQTGRLKVAAHLSDWWEEFRLYHRANGLIVKERDDLLCATRYALMMLRYASTEQRERNFWKPIDYSKIPLGIV